MAWFVNKPRFVVATAFSNVVNHRTGFDEAMFRYHIETDRVRQVIIAGHSHCSIIPFILSRTHHNPRWNQARSALEGLQIRSGHFASMSEEDKLRFMKRHVALQVKQVHEFFRNSGMEKAFSVYVGGILIDENSGMISGVTDAGIRLFYESSN